MSVHIIAAGGTFEKVYDPIDERFDFGEESVIPSILAECRVDDASFHKCMLIDSLNLKGNHRAKINSCIENSNHDRIVLVHGTSKMSETARLLAGLFAEKTIVLTGALFPFSYRASEASFNLGMAVTAAQLLPNGVYVAIQGRIIPGELVKKDPKTGRFSSEEKVGE